MTRPILAEAGLLVPHEAEAGPGLARGRPYKQFLARRRAVTAHASETVTVLIAEGHAATRATVTGGRHGVFCGMGVCFDCLVVVDGVPDARACMACGR